MVFKEEVKMMFYTILLCCIVFHNINAAKVDYSYDDMIDLTWSIGENLTLGWPGKETNRPFDLDAIHRGHWYDLGQNDTWFEAYQFASPVHAGTHMDAPCHLCKDCSKTWRINEIPLEAFFGPMVVIDIRDKVAKDRDYEITVGDIKEWEEKHGDIPQGAFVFQSSGGGDKYVTNDNKVYLGSDKANDIENYHWPGIGLEAIEYLVDVRDIKGYGVDGYTIEPASMLRNLPSSEWYQQHLKLLENNKLIFEHVSYPERVPPTGYSLHAMPLKLHNSCGAPIRLLAMKNPPSAATNIMASAGLVTALLVLMQFA